MRIDVETSVLSTVSYSYRYLTLFLVYFYRKMNLRMFMIEAGESLNKIRKEKSRLSKPAVICKYTNSRACHTSAYRSSVLVAYHIICRKF